MRAAKVVARNWLVLDRYWRASVFFSFLNPMLFLGAIGLGIGALVSARSPDAFGGVGYLAFFATGMMAATCMQTGVFESSFPILSKLHWQRNYEAMLSTPMRVSDLFLGELAWLAVRLHMIAIPFFVVMFIFGVPRLAFAPLAISVAVLTGLGFGAATMAYCGRIDNANKFNWLFRFVVTPMFLFSGTFFPLDILPSWARMVANFTPLYHGIELVRGLILFGISGPKALGHLAYLAAFLGVGIALGIRQFERRLVP